MAKIDDRIAIGVGGVRMVDVDLFPLKWSVMLSL
jgi:hypothetical protein